MNQSETLTQRSARRREALRPGGRNLDAESYRPVTAKRVLGIAARAAAMAARERERHGRRLSEHDRQDAAAQVAASLCLPDGALDTESATESDGTPARHLVAAAGACLDALHDDREAELSDSLVARSVTTRAAAESRRALAPQLLDPTADPLPPEVDGALDDAGIWPDDPLRIAVGERVLDPTPTAPDWALTRIAEGKTPGAIRKARERGAKRLDAGALDSGVAGFAASLRDRLTPTPDESAERESAESAALRESPGFDPAARPRNLRRVRPTAYASGYALLRSGAHLTAARLRIAGPQPRRPAPSRERREPSREIRTLAPWSPTRALRVIRSLDARGL